MKWPEWYTDEMLAYAHANASFMATIRSKSSLRATGKQRQLLIQQGNVWKMRCNDPAWMRANNAMQPTGATAAANGELSTGG